MFSFSPLPLVSVLLPGFLSSKRTTHMLSLTLNGLLSGLIWAWSRTPVRALQHMPLFNEQTTFPAAHLCAHFPNVLFKNLFLKEKGRKKTTEE